MQRVEIAELPRDRSRTGHGAMLRLTLVMLVVIGGFSACAGRRPSTSLDAAIAFHEAKLQEDPGLYTARAELGEALLERARITHDPHDVRRARAELEHSIATQESFQAFKAMAALCNFTHRFVEALEWSARAEGAYPEDTGVAAQQVEALLALDRAAEAADVLSRRTTAEPDFYLTAAEARIRSSEGDADGAVSAFLRAGEIAARFRARSLVLWSRVSAAAALLDSDRAAEAEPHLHAASAVDPSDPLLRIHQAEFLAATGRVPEAIAMYDGLLAETGDPVLHAAVFTLHERLGDRRAARRHFRAAEIGLRRAIDEGEVYTLETLARLYLDAGTKLDEARILAERNLRFKRDADARGLLETIRSQPRR